MADDRIGFVGLGTMGAAMAANLARGGFAVTAWNRSPDRAPELALRRLVRVLDDDRERADEAVARPERRREHLQVRGELVAELVADAPELPAHPALRDERGEEAEHGEGRCDHGENEHGDEGA